MNSVNKLIFLMLTALAKNSGFNPGQTLAESMALHPHLYSAISETQTEDVINTLTADIGTTGDITTAVNGLIDTSIGSGSIKNFVDSVYAAIASNEVTAITVPALDAIPASFADLAAARTAINDMRTDVNTDIQAIATKLNALIASLNNGGIATGPGL
jgi:hypothetical protein